MDEAFRKEASMQVMLQWVYYLLISTVNLVLMNQMFQKLLPAVANGIREIFCNLTGMAGGTTQGPGN